MEAWWTQASPCNLVADFLAPTIGGDDGECHEAPSIDHVEKSLVHWMTCNADNAGVHKVGVSPLNSYSYPYCSNSNELLEYS